MLNSKAKFLAIIMLNWSTFAYGATQHVFQVDIDQKLEDNVVVAFN